MSQTSEAESQTPVIIAVDNEHADKIADVADRLKDAGLTVDRIMHATGTISGRIEPSRIPQVRQVKGVLGLEKQRTSFTQSG